MIMPTIEVPARLAEMFESFRSAMQERAEPLDSTSEGQDIIALVEQVRNSLGNELLVFANSLGVRKFNSRLFTYSQQKRGKRNQWQLVDVQPADPEFMSGGRDKLRALMDASLQDVEGTAISIWVHPLPVGDDQLFFALIVHKDGLEAPFMLNGKRWGAMGLAGASLEMTVDMMLSPSRRHEARWDRMIEAEKSVMRDEMREDIAEFVKSISGGALTDEKWDELLALIFDRSSHRELLQETARACSAGHLHEAQRLLGAMVHLIDTTLENNQEKMSGMEKVHARALKRFQTDMVKFKSGRDIAVNRLKVVEKELTGIKKQLREVGAGHQPRTIEGAIGTALDRFFT